MKKLILLQMAGVFLFSSNVQAEMFNGYGHTKSEGCAHITKKMHKASVFGVNYVATNSCECRKEGYSGPSAYYCVQDAVNRGK